MHVLFVFWLCLVACYCHFNDYVILLCRNALLLSFYLVASPPLLLLYLLQVPMASPKTLIVALPYCFTFLLFYLVVIACFLCLPSQQFHTSFFPYRFWFLEFEEINNNELRHFFFPFFHFFFSFSFCLFFQLLVQKFRTFFNSNLCLFFFSFAGKEKTKLSSIVSFFQHKLCFSFFCYCFLFFNFCLMLLYLSLVA